jgi:hypothetical protein
MVEDAVIRWLIVAVALVSPAAAAVLYYVEPTDSTWYPKCFLNWTTGLHCPFCGATRCGHALLNGNLAQAAAWNLLTVFLLPVAALLLYWAAFRVLRRKPLPAFNPPAWCLRAFLILLFAFWFVRNLPFFPFDLLAPHKL